jgi:hypothetical protein
VHVGELAPDAWNSFCGGPFAFIQLSEAPDQPSYVVPIDGLIVRWRVNQDTGTASAKVQTFHPTSTPNRFVAGPQSALESVAPGLNSYAANLPVRRGDLIAVTLPAMSGGFWCGFSAGPASNVFGGIPGDPPPGSEVEATPQGSSTRLNLDVLIEPDNDSDGSPDESADGDDDNDGVGDGTDNCQLAPNPGQRNTDGTGDGGDACDPDDDNDSARDDADNCPTVANSDQRDSDGDGFGDACDSAMSAVPTPLRAGACENSRAGTRRSERLDGTTAGDTLLGRGGNDTLNGLGGDDCLFGGAGRDRLSASSGNDQLEGGDGNDRLSGGSGNDELDGGGGKNRFAAGSGRDKVNAANGRAERVDCGPGRDSAVVDRRDRARRCERVRRIR